MIFGKLGRTHKEVSANKHMNAFKRELSNSYTGLIILFHEPILDCRKSAPQQ